MDYGIATLSMLLILAAFRGGDASVGIECDVTVIFIWLCYICGYDYHRRTYQVEEAGIDVSEDR